MKLFLFHRDLRIEDHTSLNKIATDDEPILPVFILDPIQIDRERNEYFSDACVQFMCESLVDLNTQLNSYGSNLNVYHGDTVSVLEAIYKHVKFSAVHSTMDYTPFAKTRDEAIEKWCNQKKIKPVLTEDIPLLPISKGLREPGKPYLKFTPFLKNVLVMYKVPPVQNLPSSAKFHKDRVLVEPSKMNVSIEELSNFYEYNPALYVNGGRQVAQERLERIKSLKDYNTGRDFPALHKTTGLSASLKFGCVSSREVYWKVMQEHGSNNNLISELFWREFYLRITYFTPRILQGSSMNVKYDKIVWKNNLADFQKWKDGTTGFPIIDAGMRSLKTQGWMHNRVRMIVASFLVKNLLIDWRWGEKYFATQLIDYDPSSNNGGWQWCAGSGADSQPYFRVFNPWRQAEKFDPECEYIKKWVPELAGTPIKEILKESGHRPNYVKPMVDATKSGKESVLAYQSALQV